MSLMTYAHTVSLGLMTALITIVIIIINISISITNIIIVITIIIIIITIHSICHQNPGVRYRGPSRRLTNRPQVNTGHSLLLDSKR